jgi:hypothetical protein
VNIRLTRKYCDVLNGIDLRPFRVGQIINIDDRLAAILIVEGCAEPVRLHDVATADDRGAKPKRVTRKTP